VGSEYNARPADSRAPASATLASLTGLPVPPSHSLNLSAESPSEDPLPPPPPIQDFPAVPPRPSKAASTSSSVSSTPSRSQPLPPPEALGGEGATTVVSRDARSVAVVPDAALSPARVPGGVDEGEEEEDNLHSHSAATSNAFSSQNWGPERVVEIRRVQNQGLGISIVGENRGTITASSLTAIIMSFGCYVPHFA
jgi:hypothetical protein